MSDDKTKGSVAGELEASNTLKQDLLIRIENQIKLNELEKQKAEMMGQQLKAAQEQMSINESMTRLVSSQLEAMTSSTAKLEDMLNAGEKLRIILEQSNEKIEKTGQGYEKYKRIITDIAKIQDDIKGASDEDLATLKERLKAQYKNMEELNAQQKDAREFSREFDNYLGGAARKFGITANLAGTTSGRMAEMAANFSTGLSKDKLTFVTKAFKQLGVSILASVVDELGKIAIKVFEIGMEFQRTNGLTQDFQHLIKDSYKDNFAMGTSLDDIGKAAQTVQDSITAFNLTNKETRLELQNGITVMSRFGVSMDQSAKMVEHFARTQGMNAKQSIQASISIIKAGENVGISSKKMAKDFEQSYNSISAYGKQMQEVLIGLSKQSKLTGMEVSKLIGIADKFDTFEGAATQTQKLNAALGTSLSATDMMFMNHEERIQAIRDAVGMTGDEFEQLSYYQKKMTADAMGLQSVAEAQMMLSQNAQDQTYLDNLKESEKSLEELKKEAIKLVPPLTRFGMAITKIALALDYILTPVMGLIEIFLEIDNALGGIVAPLLTFGLMIYGVFGYIGPILAEVMTAFEALGAVVSAIVETIAGGAAGGIALIIGLGVAFAYLSDFLASISNGFAMLQPYIDAFIYAILSLGAALLFISTPAGWMIGFFAALGAVFGFFRHTIMGAVESLLIWLGVMHQTNSPVTWDLPRIFGLGFEALAVGVKMAGSAIFALGGVIIDVYKTAMQPFITGFSMIAGFLGFDMSSSEADPTTSGVKPLKTKATPQGNTNATLSAAATEIRSIVVAQLQETGIQETAKELANIAKELKNLKMNNTTLVTIDGKQVAANIVDGYMVS